MVVRMWRAQVGPAQREEFRHIEEQHIAPLLERQQGFGGVLFLYQEDEIVLLTMWRDRECAEEFATLREVQELAEQVRERGIIQGEPRVEVFEVSGGSFKGEV